MSRTLCTFPGRAGDLLWGLPTIRAISELIGERVDLMIAGEFVEMRPLLQAGAPYLDHVEALPTWGMSEGWDPQLRFDRRAPYDRIYHLGYRGWPTQPLPNEVYDIATKVCGLPLPPTLELYRPWFQLTDPPPTHKLDVACGWSDCWFELKVGLMSLLAPSMNYPLVLAPKHSRWEAECDGDDYYNPIPTSWLEAAAWIANSEVFFGDCSALHVLARALGKPVVICEPMEARWNDIFYPYGKVGNGVELVLGNDGKPTFDARACEEVLVRTVQGAK